MGTGTTPTALYRFYDTSRELLYIGMTVDLPARLIDHRKRKGWWWNIAVITVELHPSRVEAANAERFAVAAEQPRYNEKFKAHGSPSMPSPSEFLDFGLDDVLLHNPRFSYLVNALRQHRLGHPYDEWEWGKVSQEDIEKAKRVCEVLDLHPDWLTTEAVHDTLSM